MPHFTHFQRYQIEADCRRGLSISAIATGLGCPRKKVERELSRCGGRAGYTAAKAIVHRQRCAAASAANHPTKSAAVWAVVESAIRSKHSPEQAVQLARLKGLAVSRSAAYRYLHRMGRKRLQTRLRHYSAKKGYRGQMVWVSKAMPIAQRPRSVLTRDTIGHLECDSLVGRRNEPHKVVVLLDRASRHVRLGLVKDGTADGVARHIKRWSANPTIPMLTLTCDQGYEFARLPELLPGRLYACDPGKPYQKGAVENINGLIRQYLPKGRSLRNVTQAQLDHIANELNNRIRKRHGWKSPEQVLSEMTAARSP
jgi:IS30 family transposase